MSVPGLPELLIILVVVLLLFGGSKLPKLGGAIGESIKNFKKGVRDDSEAKAISSEDQKSAQNSGKSDDQNRA